MYKNIIITLFVGLLFGLDKDWTTYENHEISLNQIIIKINDNFAPKLGFETPLTMSQVFGLQDLDPNNIMACGNSWAK